MREDQHNDGSENIADVSALAARGDLHHGRLINATGTEDGVVLRIDGRAEWENILAELKPFLAERKTFLSGAKVSIEWLDRLPTTEQGKELEELLKNSYDIEITPRRKRESRLKAIKPPPGVQTRVSANSLADQIEQLVSGSESNLKPFSLRPKKSEVSTKSFAAQADINNKVNTKSYFDQISQSLGEDLLFEEDANARIYYGTLRSGQKLESPFSLVVVGDVNPGADLIAGGDIIVLGALRGTAHASAYDDEGVNRVIIAHRMQPMQLRIGSVISRGSGEPVHGPEIARIDDRRIIVESFNPRTSVLSLVKRSR
ncbi:MAG: septum site-determining protein MinC [Deltaproteobacteria bacterium]|nr:septum site-determining protein MinC [Deltaproteobacteria bacterium]